MKELCLQQRIGSCTGCPIQEMAKDKTRMSLEDSSKIIKRISKSLCPEGVIMQMPKLQKQSIM